MRVGRPGAAVNLIQQSATFEYLDVLAYCDFRDLEFVGDVSYTDKTVFFKAVKNVLVSFEVLALNIINITF